MGEGRLAQPWRAIQQDVVECVGAELCGLDKDLEVLHGLVLAAEASEGQRA